MESKLQTLITEASTKVKLQAETAQAAQKQSEQEQQTRDDANFKYYVEQALGTDVIDAIGPVEYSSNGLKREMTFTQDGRHFRILQVTGELVELHETNLKGSFQNLCHQFNLHREGTRNLFLGSLGNKLKQSSTI